MEIVKEFLKEINDIENLLIFLPDTENEPKTEWIEEIDSRTNFPFYWNSNTKESVWDIPKDYNEYLIKYEIYLKNLIAMCMEMKKSELENENNKNFNHMKGLIEYSDSEEEVMEIVDVVIDQEKNDENMEAELSPKEEENEEDLLAKKEDWMIEQADEAELYLKNLIKKLSETLITKIKCLKKENLASDSLKDNCIRVMTRFQDWNEGHLSLERKVETLKDALIEMSSFEASLEVAKWKLNWDSEKCDYFCTNLDTGKVVSHLSENKYTCEEGEIIEDEDDLALDLEEYVSGALHRSLINDTKLSEPLVNDVLCCPESAENPEKRNEPIFPTTDELKAEIDVPDKDPGESGSLEDFVLDFVDKSENNNVDKNHNGE